jgi:hypothetical protein
MKINLTILTLLLAFPNLFAAIYADDSEFEKYKSESNLTLVPHSPILDSEDKREYRTILREESKSGPNFNGHYRIVHWGLGTGVMEWAIINLKTGKVTMNGSVGSCWSPNIVKKTRKYIDGWFEFSISSSLVYLYKCDNPSPMVTNTFDIRDVFIWKDGKLKLLREEKGEF